MRRLPSLYHSVEDGEEHAKRKRLENWQRYQSIRKSVTVGPRCYCFFWDKLTQTQTNSMARVVQIYQGDFAVLSVDGVGIGHGIWLYRKGIEWGGYLRAILKFWQWGWQVPGDWVPFKKLNTELIMNLHRLSDSDLVSAFTKLRQEKLLPQIPELNSKTIHPLLNWSNLRYRFQDFQSLPSESEP